MISFSQIRNYKRVIIIIVGILFLGTSAVIYGSTHQRKCNFEIFGLQEYKGEYSEGDYYLVYEGAIRNKSRNDEYLKGMIAKIYNQDDVLVASGNATINEVVKAGTAIPFKINMYVNYRNGTKFFKINDQFKADIYPWFADCK
jgi:hypothetical protein